MHRFFLVLVLFFASCQRAALMVHQQKISPTYLASTNVGSPDPRTSPNGQMIVAEWIVPPNILDCCPMLKLQILFRDYTETCVEFPINSRAGYETYSILNKEFKKTGGFLSYKAEIVTSEGRVYADWTHQLWVKLIIADDCDADFISSMVVERSRQESVMDTPDCSSVN